MAWNVRSFVKLNIVNKSNVKYGTKSIDLKLYLAYASCIYFIVNGIYSNNVHGLLTFDFIKQQQMLQWQLSDMAAGGCSSNGYRWKSSPIKYKIMPSSLAPINCASVHEVRARSL